MYMTFSRPQPQPLLADSLQGIVLSRYDVIVHKILLTTHLVPPLELRRRGRVGAAWVT